MSSQTGFSDTSIPKRPSLILTRKLPEAIEARASRDYRTSLNPDDHIFSAEEIVERAADADALLICSTEKLTAKVIAALPQRLKAIATFSVGHEHIDIAAAKARGIIVTNTPAVLNDATADMAMALLLGACRRVREGDDMVRSGAWQGWFSAMLLGVHVTGKRIGILGMGRIGQAMARRARGFDMVVHYHNRHRLPPDLEQGAIFHDNADSLLAVSDILSIHAPSTAETRNFLNRERIALLPKGAVIVNTARGDLVDDDALIAALQNGRIAAAGLDVFRNEPQLDPRYRTLGNVLLMPHAGSATVETRHVMGSLALDNLDAIFAGRAPPTPV